MLWLKAFHVVFVVTWFAGLFYLPRLFVYHVAASDREGVARLVVMERRLFLIMTLGALLAVLCGAAMIVSAPGYLALGWMRAKLCLVGDGHLLKHRLGDRRPVLRPGAEDLHRPAEPVGIGHR